MMAFAEPQANRLTPLGLMLPGPVAKLNKVKGSAIVVSTVVSGNMGVPVFEG